MSDELDAPIVMTDEWCSMATSKSVDYKLTVISTIAGTAGIDDWSAMKSECDENHGQGHDYSQNVSLITIQDNKNPNKKMEFVMKQAPEKGDLRRLLPIIRLYSNEWYFYSTILPAFQKFQEEEVGEIIFNKITKCLAADLTDKNEKICSEYLRSQHFQKMHKRDVFDTEHLNFILREYGKFHAISIAFKKKNLQTFHQFSRYIYDFYSVISNILNDSIKEIMKESMTYLMEENDIQLIQTFKKYVEKPLEIFKLSFDYQGKNGVILHGDSWSNNMMFKYSDTNGSLEDIRLCNFQSAFFGSPVHDISFCLYSGGSKEVYANLDSFLEVYHESFSETLKRFDCSAEIVYPFKSLMREWKEYCKFGFFLSMLLMRRRLVEDGEGLPFEELLLNPEKIRTLRCDEPALKARILNLIKHMYLNDFLDTPVRIEEPVEMFDIDVFPLDY